MCINYIGNLYNIDNYYCDLSKTSGVKLQVNISVIQKTRLHNILGIQTCIVFFFFHMRVKNVKMETHGFLYIITCIVYYKYPKIESLEMSA